jgi:superfamily II DNA helicase RecQ
MSATPSPGASGRTIASAPVRAGATCHGAALVNLLHEMHTSLSDKIWGEPQLRPNQAEAAARLADPSRPSDLLLVDRTGSGKTHVTRIIGVAEKGITLVVINLHTLTADQLSKFVGANQAYGTIEAHNVDEMFQNSKVEYHKLLHRGRTLALDTTSSVFLFVSPQFICYHSDFTKMLIGAVDRRVLRLVVLDEVHLHVQQGTSFRPEIRMLKDVFFAKAYHPSRRAVRPKTIMATGTMDSNYVLLASSLTGIGLPPSAVMWAGPSDFKAFAWQTCLI